MIISKEEFRNMGFVCSTIYDLTLENCIKRAEYILNAMCGGTLASAMAQCESNAALIKQAAAFETDALLKNELSDGELTRVSVGDFSYSAEPFPHEVLGDKVILIIPTKTGFSEIPADNVRVERSEEIENGSPCRAAITVWADYHNSTWSEFPAGAKVGTTTGTKVTYNNELFEITEQRIYRAAQLHHVKFKAVKIGDERI